MAPPKFGAYKDFWPGLERIQSLASAPMGTEKECADALERLMIIARRQVRRHDFTIGAFPDDPALAARYPGIDPQGKSCEEEMELAWRMARIRAMIPLRPAEDQKKLTQLLDSLTPKTVIGGFTPAGGHLRAYDRAAKLAPTQELYDMVLAQRRALLDKTRDIPDSFVEGKVVEGDIFELHRTSHYLDVLEYYVGLRDTLPERKPYGWERQYYSPDLIASRDVPNAAPETLAVEFQRPTGHHKMQLRCDPNNWEKDIENVPPDDFDPDDPEGNRWLTRAYFRDTLGRTLDPIFAKAEALGRGEGKGFGPINRGDLIIIDGKTVREIMVERYRELERPAEEFAAYYEKHLDAAANELVGAAMMAGSEVEIFMPTASGRASDTPTRLTPTGFAPTKKEPVALSSFEKFMNRFGFFKEKAARVAKQEQEAAARRRAMEDARKRVLERNDLQYHMAKGIAASALAPAAPLPEVITSAERAAAIERFAQSEKELNFTGRTMKDAFFSSWLAEHEELPKGPAPGVETSLSYSFSSERSGLTSMAAMEMVRRGYTIEQVLDLTQLQDERRAIGEEVARRVHEGDVDWLAELFVQGTEAVNDEVSRLYAGMDLLDETRMVASSKFLPLYGACNVLFDVGQEFDRTKFNRAGGPMEAVVKRLMPDGLSDRTGGAMGYLDRSFHRHAGLQMYMRFSGSSLMQAANMAHGERVNLAETLAFPLTLKCTRGEIADARAYDPLAAPGITITPTRVLRYDALKANCQGVPRLAKYAKEGEAQFTGLGRMLLTGEFQAGLDAQADFENLRINSRMEKLPSDLDAVIRHADERRAAERETQRQAEEAARRARIAERTEAVERFAHGCEATNGSSQEMKDIFFADELAAHGSLAERPDKDIKTPFPYSFSSGRSALTSMAMMEMVRRGYTMEQIIDPAQLREEKRAVGSEIAQHVRSGHTDWISGLFVQGVTAMNNEIERLCTGLDLLDEDALIRSPKFLPLYRACDALHDACQEYKPFNKSGALAAAAERLVPADVLEKAGGAQGHIEREFYRTLGVQFYIAKLSEGLQAATALKNGATDPTAASEAVTLPIMLKSVRQDFEKARAKDPTAPPSTYMKAQTVFEHMGVTMGAPQASPIIDQAVKSAEYAAALGEMILSGEYGAGIRVQADLKNHTAHVEIGNRPPATTVEMQADAAPEQAKKENDPPVRKR